MPKIITSSLIAMLTDFWNKRCQFKNHVHFDEEKGMYMKAISYKNRPRRKQKYIINEYQVGHILPRSHCIILWFIGFCHSGPYYLLNNACKF